MNKVVKAENEKVAAMTATETQADGSAPGIEGIKQARILNAQGEAQAIQLVNEAADRLLSSATPRMLASWRRSRKPSRRKRHPRAIFELINVIGNSLVAPVAPKPVP